LLHFVKAHGSGNDFVLLHDPDDELELSPALVRALCQRQLGVGGDGIIRLGAGGDDADVWMDYRNSDGSPAEMCGNGVRCVAKYVADRGIVTGDVVRVATRGGVKDVEIVARHADGTVAQVRVDMGAPDLGAPVLIDLPPADGTAAVSATLITVSMGNPHAVLVVEDPATAPLATWGPQVGAHPAFPEGTNVEVIAVPERGLVRGRIYERGVGETLASGTGASAMATAAHVLGLADREVIVALPGGELGVSWGETTLHVTGPAVEVARGTLDERWLAAATAGEEHA
jgi:diaminopimelate epimerase